MKNSNEFYLTVPLVKFIEKDIDYSGNYLVYGQGGFGKTTSMLMLFRYFLSKAKNGENIVPIYIDSKGLDFTYEKPVFEYIIREYCGLNKDISQHIETLNDLLKNNDKKYYIIIDAINEAESNKFKVIRDIASLKEIFDKNRAGQLIVSSRIDENVYCFNDFKRIKMLDFKDEQIVNFLNKYNFKNNGKSIDKIDVERIDKNLLKILRVPMFLKIFKDVYKDADVFPDLYTKNTIHESDLLCKFVDKIIDDKIGMHKAEQSPEYIKAYFTLNRFLPAIAFELAKNDEFSISESVLDDLFENKFNKSFFKQFQNRRENYFKYAGDLDDLLNDCIDDFSFITYKGKNKKVEYSFSHQVWRDYFSAVYLATAIDYDVASEFEYQIGDNIQQYVGELIKEYEFENKTDILSPMSPMEAFMQRNCNKLDSNAIGVCIEIMKTSRNNCITACYDYLDLRESSFIYCYLSNSTFFNSKISYKNFFSTSHTASVSSVAISVNSKFAVTGSDDGTVRIWNIKNGLSLGVLYGHVNRVTSIAISQDEKRIISGSSDGTVRIWDVCTLLPINTLVGHKNSVTSIAISPDGKRIVSGSCDKTVRIWDTARIKPIVKVLKGHSSSVTCVTISSDGKKIVSGSCDKTIRIWSMLTGKQIGKALKGHTNSITSVAITSDGSKIISGSDDCSVRFWDSKKQVELHESIIQYIDEIKTICCFSTEEKLAFGCRNGAVLIWNLIKNSLDFKIVNESILNPTINSISISNNGNWAIIGDAGKRVTLINLKNNMVEWEYSDNSSIISSMTTYNNKIIYGNSDGLIYTINPYSGQILHKSNMLNGTIIQVEAIDDSLIAVNNLGKAFLFNIETLKLIRTFDTNRWLSKSPLSFSLNKKWIFVADEKGGVDIWDKNANVLISKIECGHSVVTVLSALGDQFIIAIGSHEITMWKIDLNKDQSNLECIQKVYFRKYKYQIFCVSISENNKFIYVGDARGKIHIINLKNGMEIFSFNCHNGYVSGLKPLSKQKTLCSCGSDGKIVLKSFFYKRKILAHNASVESIALFEGEKFLVSGGADGTLKIWDYSKIKEFKYINTLYSPLPGSIENANFENIEYDDINSLDFYYRVYMNSGKIPDKYKPKSLQIEEKLE